MGTIDRIIRSILALVMLVLYFTNIVTGTVGIILVMISVIFLLTSMISFCPLYVPFGLSTCKER
nr:DUF2892 domain-containing protein [Fodinibius salsisoli]